MEFFNILSTFNASNYFKNIDWFKLKDILTERYAICVYEKNDDTKVVLDNDPEFHVFNRLDSLDVYALNLHIRIIDNDKDKIITVDIKDPSDKWIVNKSTALPENLHTNIYKWYYVTVMENDKCGNERYESGTWNRVAVKEMKVIERHIITMTTKEKLCDRYKNYKSTVEE